MAIFIRMFIGFSILLASGASATTAFSSLEELFRKHYYEEYTPRHCRDNSICFAQAALENDLVERLLLIEVTNKGFSVFGMVNAEHARDTRHGEPAVDENNWHYHVFTMDEEGMVYDLDYDIRPNVVHADIYFEQMWLNETECNGHRGFGEFCAGRDKKLDDYEIRVFELTKNQSDNPELVKTVKLRELLDSLGVDSRPPVESRSLCDKLLKVDGLS